LNQVLLLTAPLTDFAIFFLGFRSFVALLEKDASNELIVHLKTPDWN